MKKDELKTFWGTWILLVLIANAVFQVVMLWVGP